MIKSILLASLFAFSTLHAETPAEFAALKAQVAGLQKQLNALQPLFALAPHVLVDTVAENGVLAPNIIFYGANVHIVNGMGQTQLSNGLGNLIIGYDELNPQMSVTDRTGSHNLVIGRYHCWINIAYGNLIAGEYNQAQGTAGFLAGHWNQTQSFSSSVVGGEGSLAYADFSVVLGGYSIEASQVLQVAQ